MGVVDRRVIKSARRVLEILEFFDADRPEATVMDIVRGLNCPQSSASELLRSLVILGYLMYDPQHRVYRPTAKVPLLGASVQTPFFGQGRLLSVMRQIHDATGLAVVLGAEVSLVVEYLHVIQATDRSERRISKGTELPLLRSGMGKALLARKSPEAVRGIVHRLNSEEANPEARVSYKDLIDEIGQYRRQGYILSSNGISPNFGMITVLLPSLDDGQNQAIGLAGPAATIEANCREFAKLIRRAIEDHLFHEKLELQAVAC